MFVPLLYWSKGISFWLDEMKTNQNQSCQLECCLDHTFREVHFSSRLVSSFSICSDCSSVVSGLSDNFATCSLSASTLGVAASTSKARFWFRFKSFWTWWRLWPRSSLWARGNRSSAQITFTGFYCLMHWLGLKRPIILKMANNGPEKRFCISWKYPVVAYCWVGQDLVKWYFLEHYW